MPCSDKKKGKHNPGKKRRAITDKQRTKKIGRGLRKAIYD